MGHADLPSLVRDMKQPLGEFEKALDTLSGHPGKFFFYRNLPSLLNREILCMACPARLFNRGSWSDRVRVRSCVPLLLFEANIGNQWTVKKTKL